jgi:hypothetical protein
VELSGRKALKEKAVIWGKYSIVPRVGDKLPRVGKEVRCPNASPPLLAIPSRGFFRIYADCELAVIILGTGRLYPNPLKKNQGESGFPSQVVTLIVARTCVVDHAMSMAYHWSLRLYGCSLMADTRVPGEAAAAMALVANGEYTRL